MNSTQIPELLSPAGTFSKLKYALAYGADAVYAGVPKFSLRTRENDFVKQTLKAGIDYTHRRGKKLYLTLNIFAHNVKIDAFVKELDKVAALNPDALIMADPGLINIALKRVPQIPIHLSTQANVTNWTSAAFWRDIGVSRIILSRELRLPEIAEIHLRVPDVELETFVHGAICIAYSGRCLITNYLNHRDANQGTCTNSCRWKYRLGVEQGSLINTEKEQISRFDGTHPAESYFVEEPERSGEHFPISEDDSGTYLFNARDLCAVELLDQISSAGVMSFKIEGRTKSEYYAALTTRAYRKAIDDLASHRPFDTQNLQDLLALSNRGYTTGFYTRNPREYGENYHDARSIELTHKAVGINAEYDSGSGLLWFELKNRLEKGTLLEIITPTELQQTTVKEIVTEKSAKVEVAHGGTGRVAIPYGADPGPFAILRRKLYSQEQAQLIKSGIRIAGDS
ncbi:MAG: U32 family peptidase [FCB group bacterium]|nr:U32 family peptidase [FCB group bacterium]